MFHKLLAVLSFAGCIYCVMQLNTPHLAFMGCYLFCCWNAWCVLNEKPRGQR
jgi:hypothetical protein